MILVLGGGWTGTRLCKRANATCVTTARTPEKVAEYQTMGLDTVVFDVSSSETWDHLPPLDQVSATIVTFALDGTDLETLEQLWSTKLNLSAPILCLGTSSTFAPVVNDGGDGGGATGGGVVDDDAREGQHGVLVTENSPTTGTGVTGRSLAGRTEAEEWALSQGAMVLHLSGICGDESEEESVRGYGPARFVGDFARKGYLRNGLKPINLIHVDDICRVALHLLETGKNLAGRRVLVTSGAYLARDIAALVGVPKLEESTVSCGKIVSNALIRTLLPSDYVFKEPMPGLRPLAMPGRADGKK